MQYITEDEIIERLDHSFQELLNANKKRLRQYFIIPIGKYGKSGTLLIYYLKKTNTFKKYETKIHFIENYTQLKYKRRSKTIPKFSIFIYLDDFLGSGNQFLKFYSNFIYPQVRHEVNVESECVLSIFFTKRSSDFILHKFSNIQLYGEIAIKAFDTEGSIFGYRKKMLPIRELAFEYGQYLFVTGKGKKRKSHPLGYKNSQSLIVFPYNVPNNTLPIIWSTKKKWYPLYRRSPKLRIDNAKRIRKEIAHTFSQYIILQADPQQIIDRKIAEGFRDLGWKQIAYLTKTDFFTLAILRLKRQKRPIPIICQLLSISQKDYSSYIKIGQERGLFDGKENISDKGLEIYFEYLKSTKELQRKLGSKKILKTRNKLYLPTQFNGRS